MSFFFHLYRAEPASPPLFEWEENRAAALGSANAVQFALAKFLPQLRWTQSIDGSWMGLTTGSSTDPIAVHVRETETGAVFFVDVAAGPNELRQVMAALALNYCCASESGEMRDPFAVGSAWGSE